MFTFIKSQAASLVASLVDFLVTIMAVELLGWRYVPGSVAGTVSGGIINFALNRNWVFAATHKNIPAQAVKYLLVWLGNLLLNAAGVYVLTHLLSLNYILSKITISLLVGLFYNYLLQKRYVFQ